MSIQYGKFKFASAPRTGTTWFIQACYEAGLGEGFKSQVHEPFTAKDNNIFKLSLVRHPYDWLQSYFMAILPGSTGIVEVDKLRFDDIPPKSFALVDAFEKFILRYLEEQPGQVGRIFQSYGADSYLKIEDMPWAACEFFASINIPPNLRNSCRSISPQNVTKKHLPRNTHLMRLVIEAEKEMMEAFDYL